MRPGRGPRRLLLTAAVPFPRNNHQDTRESATDRASTNRDGDETCIVLGVPPPDRGPPGPESDSLAVGVLMSKYGSTLFLALLSALAETLYAAWPMYQNDMHRSGVTSAKLNMPLHQVWKYVPDHPPAPAWPEPGRGMHRMDFDYAFQPVIADGLVYFGSSADATIRALDLQNGDVVWTFVTGGPVRFAPSVSNGKVYSVSDDGWLYCLDAKTAELVWKTRGAPSDRQLIANERMISRWPCRSGALVFDGVVYFTAGMWPTEGVFIYAVDAETGKRLWCNNNSGYQYTNLPHGGASGFSGVAPQGYLLATTDFLLVNTGRNIPAAFNRHTGELIYYKPDCATTSGGTRTTVAGAFFFNPQNNSYAQRMKSSHIGEAKLVTGRRGLADGMIGYSMGDCKKQIFLRTHYQVLIAPDLIFAASIGKLEACDRTRFFARRAISSDIVAWSAPCGRVYSMACAGDTLFVGGKGSITAFDAAKGGELWKSTADGRLRGFAISDGRLVAATQKGSLICFGNSPASQDLTEGNNKKESTLSLPAAYEKLARNILAKTSVSEGYALVIGRNSTRTAAALAQQTDLQIIAMVNTEKELRTETEWLLKATLYGVRVTVQIQKDPANLPFASFFASLVVASGKVPGEMINELYRVLRPCGGTLLFTDISENGAKKLLDDSAVRGDEIVNDGQMVVRKALPGAGEWRYGLADAGRTGVGQESRLRLPLELLWFGGPGPAWMLNKWYRQSTPISVNGRAFVAGENHLAAFDAFTGRELWRREMANAARDGDHHASGNMMADDSYLYIVVESKCHQLDQVTGEQRDTYDVPEALRKNAEVEYAYVLHEPKEPPQNRTGFLRWGYLGVSGDIILGSHRLPRTHEYPRYPSYDRAVFAMNMKRKSLLWVYRAKQVIPASHIVFGDDKVFLFDSVKEEQIAKDMRHGKEIAYEQVLLALDMRTGKELWSTRDIPNEVYEKERYGHFTKQLQYYQGLLILSANAVYEAATGTRLWLGPTRNYYRNPLIYGDRIIAFPRSYDLRTGKYTMIPDAFTGESSTWQAIKAYGCGGIAACRNLLFFRSGVIGLFDMRTNGLANFGGVRPSCGMNMIAANGVLLFLEHSSGCTCSYNYQTSLGLVSAGRDARTWYDYGKIRKTGDIRQIRLNIGAPGAAVDTNGAVWVGLQTGLGGRREPANPVNIMMPSGKLFHDPQLVQEMKDNEDAFVYSSGARGAGKIALDVQYRDRVHVPDCKEAPVIDGIVDDKCWSGLAPVPFAGNSHLMEPRTTLLICQDEKTFYFAYQRNAVVRDGSVVPFAARNRGEDNVECRQDDCFEVFLSGNRYRAAHFGVNSQGSRFDGKRDNARERLSTLDLVWQSNWRTAVATSADSWTAEIAIPKRRLDELGMRTGNKPFSLNVMSQNLSGTGMKRIYLADPELSFQYCRRQLSISNKPLPPGHQRSFTIRLHFAETQNIGTGDRVFDIALQGKPVLKNCDVLGEAGKRYRPVVKEFRQIPASKMISVELINSRTGSKGDLPPFVNGIEMVEEN